MSRLRRALPAALTLLTLSATPALGAGEPVMPLSEVQRGMQCTVYSVIHGTEISSFSARVEDVVYDSVNATTILATISGPAVDDGGAGPGFSGSPMYCPSSDGTPRVAGALSFGIGDYENKTVLFTPIEAMLGESVAPPVGARLATRAESRAKPLGLSLGLSGLAAPVARVFQQAAAKAGRTLYTAPAQPRATVFPVQTLRPGSAFSVGYSSGDIAFGGVGTVTYVDGPTMWGFGHPMDSAGRRALFLQDAYVYGVIKSPSTGTGASTYKLAAPGHDLGILSGDNAFSVAGTVGEGPPHFPLIVTANDLDTGAKTETRVELADESSIGNPAGFSPLGLVGTSALAQAAYGILHSSPLSTSGDMCVSFRMVEREKPMGFCNTYVAAGTGLAPDGAASLAGSSEVIDFGTAASAIDTYRLGKLTLTGVNVTLNLRRGLSQAFMTKVTGPAKMTRGKTYTVRMHFKRPRARTQSVAVKVRVPLRVPRGKRELVLSGTPSDLAGGGFASLIEDLLSGTAETDEAGPRSLDALSKQISAIHRYDGVTASLRPRRKKGEAIAAPTPSDSLPGGNQGRALREREVYRDPDLRISGAAGLKVTIR